MSSEKATTGQPDAVRCELDLDLLASALEVHAHADLAV